MRLARVLAKFCGVLPWACEPCRATMRTWRGCGGKLRIALRRIACSRCRRSCWSTMPGRQGPILLYSSPRLVRLDTTPSASWTLVPTAEAAQAARWPESLRSAVDLRIEIGPWSMDDTIGYVQTALVEAGRMEPVFEDDALRTLHELSSGIPPAEVARLADYALLAGAVAKVDAVNAAMIDEAYDEIAWPTAAVAY